MDNNTGQYVSMIEPKHDSPVVAAPPHKRRIIPFVVIGVSIVLLVILAVVLLLVVKNNGNVYSYHYSVDYKKNYQCATDEYNFRAEVFDMEFGLKSDNTYKITIGKDRYSTGTFREKDQTYAISEDGANEINYYLTLKREKSFLGKQNITEAVGDESTYILNINEKSDIVVLTNEKDKSTFYCKEKK